MNRWVANYKHTVLKNVFYLLNSHFSKHSKTLFYCFLLKINDFRFFVDNPGLGDFQPIPEGNKWWLEVLTEVLPRTWIEELNVAAGIAF